MADMTQLTGAYAASWLPWIMIPLVFYILPFPIIALVFLWIEREGNNGASSLPVSSQGTVASFGDTYNPPPSEMTSK